MEKIKVNYTRGDSIVTIILNGGNGNVIDHIMMEELQQVLNSLKEMNEIKIIVFEGHGKNFSFGASVVEHQKEFASVMLKSFHRLFYTLSELSIPTLAKISGNCLGGGLEIALMCNFIFADKTAKMGQPEIMLGVFPPPASIILPERIGFLLAEEMIITGKIISAEEAKSIGLVNAVLEDKPALDRYVDEWIEKNILLKSASSLRYSVSATRMKFNHVFNNFLPQLEALYVNELMATHDANEGINSFLEKREPVWKNN